MVIRVGYSWSEPERQAGGRAEPSLGARARMDSQSAMSANYLNIANAAPAVRNSPMNSATEQLAHPSRQPRASATDAPSRTAPAPSATAPTPSRTPPPASAVPAPASRGGCCGCWFGSLPSRPPGRMSSGFTAFMGVCLQHQWLKNNSRPVRTAHMKSSMPSRRDCGPSFAASANKPTNFFFSAAVGSRERAA